MLHSASRHHSGQVPRPVHRFINDFALSQIEREKNYTGFELVRALIRGRTKSARAPAASIMKRIA